MERQLWHNGRWERQRHNRFFYVWNVILTSLTEFLRNLCNGYGKTECWKLGITGACIRDNLPPHITSSRSLSILTFKQWWTNALIPLLLPQPYLLSILSLCGPWSSCLLPVAVLGNDIWGSGPSSLGRQQRLSEITVEPIKSWGACARFGGGGCAPGPSLKPPLFVA